MQINNWKNVFKLEKRLKTMLLSFHLSAIYLDNIYIQIKYTDILYVVAV